jgi:hypothetical protein
LLIIPGKVWGFYSSLTTLSDRNHPEHWQSENNRFTFTVAPYPDGNSTSTVERRKDGVGESSMNTGTKQFSDKTKPFTLLYGVKKKEYVYILTRKKFGIYPKFCLKMHFIILVVYWLQGATDDGNYYLSNLAPRSGHT